MTTELAHQDLATVPMTWTTLNAISNTELVPKAFRGKPDAMLAATLLGRELGLGPMQSMQMIDVIDGRPSLSAELQTAMIRDAGHSMLCTEMTDQSVTVKGTRVDSGDEMPVTFTIAMAERAGLAAKRNWQQYPEAMLWARAVSMLARMLFADVFAATHVYTADELGSEIDIPVVEVVRPAAPSAPVASPDTADLAGDDDSPVAFTPHEGPTTEALETSLTELLAEKPREGSMRDIETRVRAMCHIGGLLGFLPDRGDVDYLHTGLAHVGAEHVGDLKRAELETFAAKVRDGVSTRFAEYLVEIVAVDRCTCDSSGQCATCSDERESA